MLGVRSRVLRGILQTRGCAPNLYAIPPRAAKFPRGAATPVAAYRRGAAALAHTQPKDKRDALWPDREARTRGKDRCDGRRAGVCIIHAERLGRRVRVREALCKIFIW